MADKRIPEFITIFIKAEPVESSIPIHNAFLFRCTNLATAKNWNKIPRSSVLRSLHRCKPSQRPWDVCWIYILLLKFNAPEVKLSESTKRKVNLIHDSRCRTQTASHTEYSRLFSFTETTVIWRGNISYSRMGLLICTQWNITTLIQLHDTGGTSRTGVIKDVYTQPI